MPVVAQHAPQSPSNTTTGLTLAAQMGGGTPLGSTPEPNEDASVYADSTPSVKCWLESSESGSCACDQWPRSRVKSLVFCTKEISRLMKALLHVTDGVGRSEVGSTGNTVE